MSFLSGKRLALLVACFAMAGLPAWSVQEEGAHVEGVNFVLRTPWPRSVNKGYQPLSVEMENTNKRDVSISITASGGYGDSIRMTRSVGLRAGETRKIELLLPSFVASASDFRVALEIGGSRERLYGFGSTGETGNSVHSIALFTNSVKANGRDVKWSTSLSPAASTTAGSTSPYFNPTIPWRNLGIYNHLQWSANAKVNIAEIGYDWMSTNWQAYSSLDMAVVETESGMPSQAELDALLAWVRMGGVVMFSGRNVNQSMAAIEDVRGWLEDRFLVQTSARGPLGVRTYQCGFGRVLVHSGEDLLDGEEAQEAILGNLRSKIRTGLTPSPRGSRISGAGVVPNIPGVGILPYRTFVTLMVIFAVVVGPINFWYMRRRNTPIKLLFTIPLLAAGSSVAILSYGFFWQGVSIRTDSHSVSLLDQRTGLVSTADSRALFAGLAPGRGLVPGQGTAIFPLGVDLVNRPDATYSIEQDGATSFGTGFLPSRVQVRQAVLTARTSHLRLEFDESAGGLVVRNALDVPVEGLVVHSSDGAWYSLVDRTIEVGGEARLTPIDGSPTSDRQMWLKRKPEEFWTFHPLDLPELPRGSYTAHLESDPFIDDCGIRTTEVSGSHGLLGVMGATR